MEEEPSALWTTLHNRYQQQKAVILSEANHDWVHLRLYDYKSIEDYNHVVHKICVNYGFVRKNLLMKIRYRARNYQHYSKLIQDLLHSKKHDELTLRNHHQRLIGTTTLPEVNYSSKGKEKVDENRPPKNVGKFKKAKEISTRKTNPKTKVRGNEINPLSATAVVVLIIL
jgi:hypothetical protein